MKSRIEIELDNDTLQKLSVEAYGVSQSISEYVEKVILDLLAPVSTDQQQMELEIEESVPEPEPEVKKIKEPSKDLTKPPFNKYGEKPVSLKNETSTSWVDPKYKKTTNSWKF
jgi:hypothetical protein